MESIVKQCLREKTPIPDFIQNAPELSPGLELYFTAYDDLRGDKSFSGQTPWTAMIQYAKYHGFSKDQTDALVYHIKAMDTANAEYQKEKGS